MTKIKSPQTKKVKSNKCTCKKPEFEQKQVTDHDGSGSFTYWVNGNVCIKCQKLL